MASKKGMIGAVAAIGAAPLLVTGLVFALVVAMLAGAAVSVVGGGLGAMFGDKNIQQQYGFFGCDGSNAGPGVPVSGTQQEYIQTMIGIAKTMGVNERGQVIAVMTMLQESSIKNYANSGKNIRGYNGFPAPGRDYWLNVAKLSLKYPHDAVGNDADSVGLFQQRASAGWADDSNFKATNNPDAAIKRLLDPRWGVQQFFGGPGGSPNRGLLDISGWESLPMGQAAQKVQGSAFPDAYDKWQAQATQLVQANASAPAIPLLGGGGSTPAPTDPGDGDSGDNAVQWPMAEGTYTLTSGFGPRESPGGIGSSNHRGIDLAAPTGTPIYAAADGVVSASGPVNGYGNWVVIDHVLNGERVSTLYGHMTNASIKVRTGDQVTKGQHIAGVASEGNSTGPHLHFEVWPGGRFDGGQPIDPAPWLGGNYTSGGLQVTCNGGGSPITATGTVGAIFQSFESILGTPYSWGGGDLNGSTEGIDWGGVSGVGIVGFDCSSALRYAVYHGTGGENGGLVLPRTAQEQFNFTRGTTVWNPGMSTDALQPGDLLFYGSSTGNITHVALYIGNGRMYEALRTGVPLRETDLRTDRMVAATRLELSDNEPTEKPGG